MVIQVIAAFVAIYTFSVCINAPKKYLVYCGLVGALGWLVYLLTREPCGVVMANFLGALAIAMISQIFARVFKAPVTVFLIPGILVLVPGAGMYRTGYQLFIGNRAEAMNYLLETLQVAGMIAVAIFVTDSLFAVFQKRK